MLSTLLPTRRREAAVVAARAAREAAPAVVDPGLTTAEIQHFLVRLAHLDREVTDAERLDRIEALEAIKGAAAAAQAVDTRDFDASQREIHVEAGRHPSRVGAGVAHQIAMARRESPWRGRRHVGLAAVLPEMPHTAAALTAGRISEWRATLVARSTAVLSLEHRREVDARLADRLPRMSDKETSAAADAVAYELDPQSPFRRARAAAFDRRVSVRPAPDTMAVVCGFVPVAQGVAVKKALRQAATAVKASGGAGEERSIAQIEADMFVQRLTGQAVVDDVAVEVGLVMTDATLIAGADAPARLEGYGPIPAGLARDLLRPTTATGTRRSARMFLRRLFTDPVDGALTDGDRRRRLFTGAHRDLVIARDQYCRTPFCDAPIRDADHAVRATDGGPTTTRNAQGLCQHCNQAKEAAGWRAVPIWDPDHSHFTITAKPNGRYDTSAAPPTLPTYRPPPREPVIVPRE